MGGVCLSWPASLQSGPACLVGARRGPEMFLLEALVAPFSGAQDRRDPYPVMKPCKW